jgi:RimJ/RimL family protein N-acetyltransferase
VFPLEHISEDKQPDEREGHQMKYVNKLDGDRIYLSPMQVEDAETYVRWLSDPLVTDGLGNTCRVMSVEDEKEWIKKNAGTNQFAIIRKADHQLLGNCGLHQIDALRQCAEVGLFIGEAENRGKGYGVEVLNLLLAHAFDTLNLNNVMLRVFSFNENAIRCYGKVGFREMGRRRQSYYVRGQFHDEVFMDILKTDFNRMRGM